MPGECGEEGGLLAPTPRLLPDERALEVVPGVALGVQPGVVPLSVQGVRVQLALIPRHAGREVPGLDGFRFVLVVFLVDNIMRGRPGVGVVILPLLIITGKGSRLWV